MKPLIVINFKNYREAMGSKGLKLAAFASAYDNVIICPQYMELDNTSVIMSNVFSQHADPFLEGAQTGKVSILAVKNAGAKGVLLNHSENRIPFSQIKETVNLLKQNKMQSIICAETVGEAEKLAKFEPDYIAYEPKEFIGQKVDITELKNETIKEIAEKISPVKLLIGAGISSPEEIRRAMQLGAIGVLTSSNVVKNNNPARMIRELANA